jgi:hypothetical protein
MEPRGRGQQRKPLVLVAYSYGAMIPLFWDELLPYLLGIGLLEVAGLDGGPVDGDPLGRCRCLASEGRPSKFITRWTRPLKLT